MNIEIHYRPYFTVHLPKGTLPLLIKLSQAHYDMRCRQASMPGGLLRKWEALEAFMGEDPIQVTAQPDDLDTCMKMCEMARSIFGPAERALIDEFRTAVAKAMVEAKLWSAGAEASIGLNDI